MSDDEREDSADGGAPADAERASPETKADLLRQLGDGLASVALQHIEHLDLEIIELRHFHSVLTLTE